MQRAAPPQSLPPPDRRGSVWLAGHRQTGERWCRCSQASGAWAPAGTQADPETAPCC